MAEKGRRTVEEKINEVIGRIQEWVHMVHVANSGKLLSSYCRDDKFNKNSIEIACLVHEMNDYKLFKGSEEEGKQYLINYLKEFGLNDEYANEIEDIVSKISFRCGLNQINKDNLSLECQIVQDAIGAIDIARMFAYSRHRNRGVDRKCPQLRNFKTRFWIEKWLGRRQQLIFT
ncbi:unnamed protein product [Dimorphilus gyrociliatus]|uniref:Uncharacterized protein n=1 Tax=Dimorphilus gyrociliatus TaxID=2664684 RepID=A0A7I8WE24_9ANNE|nr:unnamed protein product [Dimorphilus gyrociliatus]